MATLIQSLALQFLDEREQALAFHLSLLLGDPKLDAFSVMGDILPKYYEKVGNHYSTLEPRSVYRSLLSALGFGHETFERAYAGIYCNDR